MCEHLEIILLESFKHNKQYVFPMNQQLYDNFYMAVCLDCNSTLLRQFKDYHKTHWVTTFTQKSKEQVYPIYHHRSIYDPERDGE